MVLSQLSYPIGLINDSLKPLTSRSLGQLSYPIELIKGHLHLEFEKKSLKKESDGLDDLTKLPPFGGKGNMAFM